MSGVIETAGLGKAYRRHWALRDCTLAIRLPQPRSLDDAAHATPSEKQLRKVMR